MLRPFKSEPRIQTSKAYAPPVAAPLIAAAEQGKAVQPALEGLVRQLGFEHFLYAVAPSPAPAASSRAYVWTNVPAAWVAQYDAHGFVEVDPRPKAAWASPLPLLWDRRAFEGGSANEAFFDAATRHGVCSGVTLMLPNRFDAPGMFTLSSPCPSMAERVSRVVRSRLGDIIALAGFLHEQALQSVVEECMPSLHPGRALSPRERACLESAARGLNSREIGAVLGIGERTIHTHFTSILAKLGAANRQEAIAMASGIGLIAA
jgi:DNA-binding CsgD family transcriptional regulator